ncbi:hypothetical protein IQ269_03690 [Tychonema sp. LEGE 07199]|uniref:hypothetical protein n=1 Tax=unclassified Tychonema TaxID=2642144 RepID=UPI001881F99E|nr:MULTISPECIES: hypothetical protein [unclassified Tychonema]MBE9119929.1 hypothetical protein [Tychonema sp. LEGE 07199]MBE9130801.1 hypothetical protein [Tychonema sp. LEGE 07196]
MNANGLILNLSFSAFYAASAVKKIHKIGKTLFSSSLFLRVFAVRKKSMMNANGLILNLSFSAFYAASAVKKNPQNWELSLPSRLRGS